MKAMLLNIGLALLCVLETQAEVPVQPDFDVNKFAGTWHIMVAASNCPQFLSMKEVMKTSVTIITPMPGGDLTLTAVMGKRDFRVVETDYAHYAIVYVRKDKDGKTSVTLQLFSRVQDVHPEALKRFKELYPTMGLTEDILVILPKSDRCAKALGWIKEASVI
ncbi:lipocalin-15-like [Alligator mississippiensis]|uniref:lipocalin-15-like n=1 Tax=Alligator mississippiensis TaxID=8496 RepID=UPI0028780E7A|nr:lipocalin-15-like [Alligator mississippiensis]